jgi:hypothetical protein
MIEGKGLGNKKVNRVNVSLSNRNMSKLDRLATACNMKPTTLAGLLIEKAMNDSNYINELQDQYCTQKAYKIIPVNNNGELVFTLTGRSDL